jgi:hypothetical protein
MTKTVCLLLSDYNHIPRRLTFELHSSCRGKSPPRMFVRPSIQERIVSICGAVIQGSYKVKYRLAAMRRVPLAGTRLASDLLAADQPAVLVLLRLASFPARSGSGSRTPCWTTFPPRCEHAEHLLPRRAACALVGARRRVSAVGSVTSSVVPCPMGLATLIVPPSASTRSVRPVSPEPRVGSPLRSHRRGWTAGGHRHVLVPAASWPMASDMTARLEAINEYEFIVCGCGR